MTKEKKVRFIKEAKKVIDKLAEKGVVVKPMDLVNVARDKNSSLHGYFVWDNTEAAEAYRCHQAGQLIGRVRCTYENRSAPAYTKLKVEVEYQKEPEEGYITTARVLSDKDLRLQVINKGLNELNCWISKYSVYDELLNLVNTAKMEQLKVFLKAEK